MEKEAQELFQNNVEDNFLLKLLKEEKLEETSIEELKEKIGS